MTSNSSFEETLLDQALDWFNSTLGPVFKAERQERTIAGLTRAPQRVDGLITIAAQNNQSTLSVEARRSLAPRDAERLLDTQQRFASLAYISLLFVAPWLSARTREIISSRGANYLDLTGNCLIRLDNPPMYVRVDGATKDPAPSTQSTTRLRGAKAGRLVRLLAEVRPPYGVREIAEKTKLTPGYISRLLEALDRDALVRRERGRVTAVDYARLIQQYAATYSLTKESGAAAFIAPAGAARALSRLAELAQPTAVTGSFAASRLAPVAAPTLLAIYASDPRAVADELKLLPSDEGANVLLLEPRDPVAWDRGESVDGVRYAAPAQVAMDCLAGNGRMPAEGMAVLEWMTANEPIWQATALADVPAYAAGPT